MEKGQFRRGEGRARRIRSVDEDVKAAFSKAHEAFVKEYSRAPHYDFVLIQGAFTTTEVIIEIAEEVQ